MWEIALSSILRRPWPYVCLLALWATCGHTAVSVNLPLDDPAYPLLEKLVGSNLTFRNALTLKPITRLYAAQLIAEVIQQRRENGTDPTSGRIPGPDITVPRRALQA